MSPLEQRLHDALDGCGTRDGFGKFMQVLVEDLLQEGDNWCNRDLETFLRGLAGVARRYESFFDTPSEGGAAVSEVSWQHLAQMLFVTRCTCCGGAL
jgi:hypothetical protein